MLSGEGGPTTTAGFGMENFAAFSGRAEEKITEFYAQNYMRVHSTSHRVPRSCYLEGRKDGPSRSWLRRERRKRCPFCIGPKEASISTVSTPPAR